MVIMIMVTIIMEEEMLNIDASGADNTQLWMRWYLNIWHLTWSLKQDLRAVTEMSSLPW